MDLNFGGTTKILKQAKKHKKKSKGLLPLVSLSKGQLKISTNRPDSQPRAGKKRKAPSRDDENTKPSRPEKRIRSEKSADEAAVVFGARAKSPKREGKSGRPDRERKYTQVRSEPVDSVAQPAPRAPEEAPKRKPRKHSRSNPVKQEPKRMPLLIGSLAGLEGSGGSGAVAAAQSASSSVGARVHSSQHLWEGAEEDAPAAGGAAPASGMGSAEGPVSVEEQAREELRARAWIQSAKAGASSAVSEAQELCGAGSNGQYLRAFAALGLCGGAVARAVAEPDAVSSSAVGRRGLGLRAPTKVQRALGPLLVMEGSRLPQGGTGVVGAGEAEARLPVDAGRDAVVQAETGSGKTLAFALPVLHWLLQQGYGGRSPGGKGQGQGQGQEAKGSSGAGDSKGGGVGDMRAMGTRCLVLVPTRELAAQVHGVLERLCAPFARVVVALVAGGEKRKTEKARLRKGAAVVVATPGRCLDHLQSTEAWKVDRLAWLVCDEWDRVTAEGQGEQLRRCVSEIRRQKTGQKRAPQVKPDDSGDGKRAGTFDSEYDLPSPWSAGLMEPFRVVLLSATLGPDMRGVAAASLQSPPWLVDGDKGSVRLLGVEAREVQPEEEGGDKDGPEGKGGAAGGQDEGAGQGQSQAQLLGPISSGGAGSGAAASGAGAGAPSSSRMLHAPPQLAQRVAPVPLRWRLPALCACLRHFLERPLGRSQDPRRKGSRGSDSSASVRWSDPAARLVVFFSCRDSAEFHHKLLQAVWPQLLADARAAKGGDGEGGTRAAALPRLLLLHGGASTSERRAAVEELRTAPRACLVTTDVAARGLDLPGVDVIVQADAPHDPEDYVHRAGRTARGGRHGRALMLLAPHEAPFAAYLKNRGLKLGQQSNATLLKALATAPPPSKLALPSGRPSPKEDQGEDEGPKYRSDGVSAPRELSALRRLLETPVASDAAAAATADAVELRASQWQAALEVVAGGAPWLGKNPLATRLGLGDAGLRETAIKGWQSHVRAYACHSRELRPFFNPREVHLGHAARAFGLADAPAELSRQARQTRANEGKKDGKSHGRRDGGRKGDGEEDEELGAGGRASDASESGDRRKKSSKRDRDRGSGRDRGSHATGSSGASSSSSSSSSSAAGVSSSEMSRQLALAASIGDGAFDAPDRDDGAGGSDDDRAKAKGKRGQGRDRKQGDGGSSRGEAHAYWRLYGEQPKGQRKDQNDSRSGGGSGGHKGSGKGKSGGRGRMGLSAQSLASEFSA